jgi:tetratricopeptide (TPR) repeat protein
MRRIVRRWGPVVLACAVGCGSPSTAINQRGVALFNSGRYDAAADEFSRAAEADPLSADAFYNLASAHHRLGDVAEAEANYSHALALAPNHSKARHAHVVLMLEQDRTDDAFAAVDQWLSESPASPDPMIEMAWLERQAGRNERAHELLQQTLAIHPSHPRALAELASLYEASGEPDRALALYNRALAADPNRAELAAKASSVRSAMAPSPRNHASLDESLDTATAAPLSRPPRDLRYQMR